MKLRLEIEKWNWRDNFLNLIIKEVLKLKRKKEWRKTQSKDLLWKESCGMVKKQIY